MPVGEKHTPLPLAGFRKSIANRRPKFFSLSEMDTKPRGG